MQKMSEAGIVEQIMHLGIRSRRDVLDLMRLSAAVINPSLFEGWGMTVDEARSLGKPVLISDVAAHREQDPPGATYVDPLDVRDMADKLGAVWTSAAPGPDPDAERTAGAELAARARAFGTAFTRLVREAVAEKRAARS
jgi:glycosyltransferase involved in cell wall biosynthesis